MSYTILVLSRVNRSHWFLEDGVFRTHVRGITAKIHKVQEASSHEKHMLFCMLNWSIYHNISMISHPRFSNFVSLIYCRSCCYTFRHPSISFHTQKWVWAPARLVLFSQDNRSCLFQGHQQVLAFETHPHAKKARNFRSDAIKMGESWQLLVKNGIPWSSNLMLKTSVFPAVFSIFYQAVGNPQILILMQNQALIMGISL